MCHQEPEQIVPLGGLHTVDICVSVAEISRWDLWYSHFAGGNHQQHPNLVEHVPLKKSQSANAHRCEDFAVAAGLLNRRGPMAAEEDRGLEVEAHLTVETCDEAVHLAGCGINHVVIICTANTN